MPPFSVQFSGYITLIVGVFNGEGPPVPIPNTEVKLTSAENTCLETDWEDRSMPTQNRFFKAVLFLCLIDYGNAACSVLILSIDYILVNVYIISVQ